MAIKKIEDVSDRCGRLEKSQAELTKEVNTLSINVVQSSADLTKEFTRLFHNLETTIIKENSEQDKKSIESRVKVGILFSCLGMFFGMVGSIIIFWVKSRI
jgi:hypothetical protein